MTAQLLDLVNLRVVSTARKLGVVGAALGWPAEAEKCPRMLEVLNNLPEGDPLRRGVASAYAVGYSDQRRAERVAP